MDGIAPAPTPLAPAKGKKVKASLRHSANPGMELGVLLSLLILALYFYGFLESIFALPDIQNQLMPPPRLFDDANLNVAVDSYERVGATKDTLGAVVKPDNSANAFVRLVNIADIPQHVWPPSVRNEPDNFETIIHPGDEVTTLSVPKFWSPPIHQGGLMSRELAMKIGSCSVPDSKTGSLARGEDCPEDDRTIYFAIASYRDFQCRFTVESAFMRAKNPKRIRVGELRNGEDDDPVSRFDAGLTDFLFLVTGVVDQIVDGEDPACNVPIEPCDVNPNQALCLYKDQVDVYGVSSKNCCVRYRMSSYWLTPLLRHRPVHRDGG
jgi:hypothetical protein